MTDLEKKDAALNRGRNQPAKQVAVNICDSITSEERIQSLEHALHRKKLLKSEYIYSAFHPSKLEDVLTSGSARAGKSIDGYIASSYFNENDNQNDSDSIFCITVSKSGSSMRFDNDDEYSIVSYLEQRVEGDVSYIAIYQRKDFIDDIHRAISKKILNHARQDPVLLLIQKINCNRL